MKNKVRIRACVNNRAELTFSFGESVSNKISRVSVEYIMKRLIEKSIEYFQKDMRVPISEQSTAKITKTTKLNIKEIASIINLTGSLNAMFIMSFDEELARFLVERFVIDKLTSEEERNYIEDTVAEISNIIVGNTIEIISDLAGPVTFEATVTIRSAEASCHIPFINIWYSNLKTGYGEISLNFLVNNSLEENNK